MVPLLLLILSALGAAILTAEGNVILYLLSASWIISLLAIARIMVGRRSGVGPAVTSPTRQRIFATLLLISQVALSLAVAGAARRMALDAVSAANLRGIGEGLRQYCTQFGTAPASFEDLLTSGICTPGQFICPWSDDQERPDGTLVSSYVFYGGADVCSGDPRRPVAAERDAWTALGLRVCFRRYGRQVLFADGHVKAQETHESAVQYR